jgi:hypothetical protein
MSTKEKIKGIFKSRLKLEPGTRATSFLFIATSIAIAAGILLAANMYYNIDTGEVVVEEIQRVSNVLRATAGLIVGGTATQNPSTGYVFEVVGSSKLATTTIATGPLTLSAANQELRFTGGTSYYVGFKATTTLSQTTVYTWPASYPAGTNYVLTSDTSGNMSWTAAGTGGIGDVTGVGDCGSGDCFSNAQGAPTSTTLWFKSGSYYGALNVGSLTANATYTLPAVSAGTYYFILASTGLTANQIPYMTGAYTIGGSDNLKFDATNRILTVGSSNNTGQLRLYSNNANYVGFGAASSLGSSVTYSWPAAPTASGYLLTSDTSGNLSWVATGTLGAGDITAVGDCASGDCFTGTSGSTLWFKSGSFTGALTVATLGGNATYTLPAVTGSNTIALGSGTANYVAYWTGGNTLGAEQYLSTSRGGIGTSSAAWTGLVRVSGGSWSAFTGTTSSLAYWSSNSQLGSFPFGTAGQLLVSQGSGNVATWTAATYPTTVSGANQAIYSSGANAFTVGTLPVAAGGTGRSSWTQYGVVYADGSTSLTSTVPGTNYYILTGSGSAAPQWRSISQLVFADNGLSATGTATTTLRLGGTLIQDTTIGLNNYNLLFNLASGGTSEKFAVQVGGSDILVVNDQGQILYKNYPLAYSQKQVLREMVPIFGFDLPVKTTTTTAVKISRDIVSYPLNPCESGASRVHKLVVRYGSTGTSTIAIATSGGEQASSTLPNTNSTSTGSVATVPLSIPTPAGNCSTWTQGTDTTDWWVTIRLNQASTEIMVYQIFLAGYDQLP